NSLLSFVFRFALMTQWALRMAIFAFKIPVETSTPPCGGRPVTYNGFELYHMNYRVSIIFLKVYFAGLAKGKLLRLSLPLFGRNCCLGFLMGLFSRVFRMGLMFICEYVQ
ncbi:MAG: hypothetical protein FWC93_06360, partial [Defluviitaleaceae bacterium]|nr:hypothetical protein [Defluviitaleaceae bacterium]